MREELMNNSRVNLLPRCSKIIEESVIKSGEGASVVRRSISGVNPHTTKLNNLLSGAMDLLKFAKKLWCVRKQLVLLITPGLLLPLLFFLPQKEGKCLYVVLLMATYWCTEALPLAVTALLPICLFPTMGILPSKKVCPQYFLETNFLFLSGLVMAAAIEEWGLHRRIALRVLKIVGVKPAWLILGMMCTSSFLSMWLSNSATTAMMLPIANAILESLFGNLETLKERCKITDDPEDQSQVKLNVLFCEQTLTADERADGIEKIEEKNEEARKEAQYQLKVWKGFLICIPYAASIGGTATLTGTAPNLIFIGQLKSFAEKAISSFFILFAILLFTRDPKFVKGWSILFRKDYVSDAVTGVIIVSILFFFPSKCPSLRWWLNSTASNTPYVPLLSWKRVQECVPWNIILLLGGGFAMAKGCEESGLAVWIGGRLQPLATIPPPLAVILITAFIACFTEFASNTATIIIFLPVISEMANHVNVNPLYFMIPATVGCSYAFMLPVSTPPNSIAFASGHLMVKDMVKTGFMMNILGTLCVSLAVNTWGQRMFNLDTYPNWAKPLNSTELRVPAVNVTV
ncbi:solute carrier family 13 member 3 isoform X3 [Neoarius graeffei]|uniref:solute carrier family 13 member 3 isoform X3 n=1 Tax=Neoarius graeffei TaxID=443677 RepID=UPI00298C22E9|nr:solute carrier family 13 member 3 isoform X3 [Neoarius graeffei]